MTEQWKDGPGLERPALDSFYRTERWWRYAAFWFAISGSIIIVLASSDGRIPGITLIALSLPCELISWRAMRGAQRLEKRRLARLSAPVVERWKGQA